MKTSRREPFPHLSQDITGLHGVDVLRGHSEPALGTLRATAAAAGGSHCPERWAVGGLTTHLGSNSRYTWCERGCWEVPSGSAGPAQTDGLEQPTRQMIDPCGSCSRLFVSTCENQPSDRRLEQRLRFCDSRGCAGLVDTAHDCDFTSVVLI